MKDSQAQEDIWHLTLDDLWAAPPEEPPRLGGDGPFVINLSTSPAPIAVPPKNELHIENISVYCISRNEDGRQRFRLRLGPISTELEADAILSAVRERYPGAMTATATDEDLRAIGHATRNTKGAKPATTPPPATPPAAARPIARTPTEKNGAKPAAKPVETKTAARAPEAKAATRPPSPRPEAKVSARPSAPKAEAKPPSKSTDEFIVMLPPAPVIEQHDDSDEPTGTGWEIDSLLPHLTGPAPQPKAKAPVAKAAPVARKVAPPAKPKAPTVAKPAAPSPAPAKPVAATPPAPTAPAKAHVPPAAKPPVLTAEIETPKPVAAPPAPPAAASEPVATAEPAAHVSAAEPIAPVVQPPAAEIAKPPIVEVVATPVVEVPAPPVVEATAVAPAAAAPPLVFEIAQPLPAPEPVVPPVNVAEPTPAPIAKLPPAFVVERTPAPPAKREAPAAVSLPPLTVRNPRVEVRKSPAVKTEPAKPVVADKPPVIAPPVAEKAKPPLPEILSHDAPPADPLETDWAAILSAPVEDTQSRKALHVHLPTPPVPAPATATATTTATTRAQAPAAKANDDSGLQRLVERSNALVEQMDTQADAVPAEAPVVSATLVSAPEAPQPAKVAYADSVPLVTEPTEPPISATQVSPVIAAEPAPQAVIFSPLNTQSIEQKLAKLAEILHGGGEPAAAAPSAPEAPPPAPEPVKPVADVAAPSEPVPVPSTTLASTSETDFDVEISFDDDAFDAPDPAPRPATKPWFEPDRRHEPRPTLKSPDEVVKAIDELVVVDVANNLADVVARQKEPPIDATAETDRRPALVIPEESKPQDPPPEALKLEIAAVETPIAEPTPATVSPTPVAPAVATPTELTLAPEVTLGPAKPSPPPVHIEAPIVEKPAQIATLELAAEPAAPSPAVSSTSDSVIVPRLPDLEFTIDEPAPVVAATPEPKKSHPEPKVEAPKVEAPKVEPAKVEPTRVEATPARHVEEPVSVISTVVLDNPVPKPQPEVPHVSTVVLEPAPVVIRSRESTADHGGKSAQHMSARAAARAAKKLRLAKDAAKKAAAAAAKANGAAPAKADAVPPVTSTAPAKPAPAAEKPSAPQTAHVPAAAHAPTPTHAPAPTHTPVAAHPPAPTHSPTPAHAPAHVPAPSNKKHAPQPSKRLAAKPQPPAAKPQPAAAKSQSPAPKHVHAPARPAASPPYAKQPPAAPMRPAVSGERKVTIRSEHSGAMDSTQTIRALTPLELADDQISKWYVIQLATSEDDFDPDQIPQLDIFDAFRLYSVIGLDGPRILHALRLGFFSDEISAQAVHGYLKSHFDGAAVKRVSIAERERFAESQVEARKDIGATGMHAVIEMASPTPVPETRLADLQAAANPRPAEEKSIWSRIVSPLKRQ